MGGAISHDKDQPHGFWSHLEHSARNWGIPCPRRSDDHARRAVRPSVGGPWKLRHEWDCPVSLVPRICLPLLGWARETLRRDCRQIDKSDEYRTVAMHSFRARWLRFNTLAVVRELPSYLTKNSKEDYGNDSNRGSNDEGGASF
jgi:hypothetical protein